MRVGFAAEEGCDAFSQTGGGMCRIDSVAWLAHFPASASLASRFRGNDVENDS